ncbi:MAG: disulfide bond formation protein B [Candidatus Pseudothioglobus sp.]|jgi:disulfide bond formation protein DsbB|tara:strand:- start:503 stop:1009 length:507 start_codon:yes stop_codon:yes gene_type:complete
MSYSISSFTSRQINLVIFLIVGSLLGYAAYSMKILGLEPCTLCITQQFFYCLIGISSFVSFLQNPGVTISRVYSFFISLFAIAGIWISGRQIWLQGLPEDEVPLCGPPLEYIIDVFPFADVLNALFMGDGNCAEIPWQFLGLSMAGWSFIWFLVIFFLSVISLIKSRA